MSDWPFVKQETHVALLNTYILNTLHYSTTIFSLKIAIIPLFYHKLLDYMTTILVAALWLISFLGFLWGQLVFIMENNGVIIALTDLLHTVIRNRYYDTPLHDNIDSMSWIICSGTTAVHKKYLRINSKCILNRMYLNRMALIYSHMIM